LGLLAATLLPLGPTISFYRVYKSTNIETVDYGVVVDITSLFTVLDTDQARVYIPNNSVLTNVIKQYKQPKL